MSGDQDALEAVRGVAGFIFLESGRKRLSKIAEPFKSEYRIDREKLAISDQARHLFIFVEWKRGCFYIYVTRHMVRVGRPVPYNVVSHNEIVNQVLDGVVRNLRGAFGTMNYWRDFIRFDPASTDYMLLKLAFQ